MTGAPQGALVFDVRAAHKSAAPTPRDGAAPTKNKTFERRALARDAAQNASPPKSIDERLVPCGIRGNGAGTKLFRRRDEKVVDSVVRAAKTPFADAMKITRSVRWLAT